MTGTSSCSFSLADGREVAVGGALEGVQRREVVERLGEVLGALLERPAELDLLAARPPPRRARAGRWPRRRPPAAAGRSRAACVKGLARGHERAAQLEAEVARGQPAHERSSWSCGPSSGSSTRAPPADARVVRDIADELFVVAPALVDVGLDLLDQVLGALRVRAAEDAEARLRGDELAHRHRRRARVELERLAVPGRRGLEAVQRPVAAADRVLHVVHRLRHVDAVGRAGAVGDHERRSRPGVGLEERLDRLGVVGPHGDLRDVGGAVGHRQRAEVLLRASTFPRRRTWPRRRAASPWTPVRRCWSRPPCPARGC